MELDEPLSIETLQAQMFALTNVPIERQKILAKGKRLKADEDLKKLKDVIDPLKMHTHTHCLPLFYFIFIS